MAFARVIKKRSRYVGLLLVITYNCNEYMSIKTNKKNKKICSRSKGESGAESGKFEVSIAISGISESYWESVRRSYRNTRRGRVCQLWNCF